MTSTHEKTRAAEPAEPVEVACAEAPADAADSAGDEAAEDSGSASRGKAPVVVDAEDAAADEPAAELPLTARVEALVFASDRPVVEARLGALLGIPTRGAAKRVREAIDALNAAYAETGRAFRLVRLAGGWQVMTEPEYGVLVARMFRERQQTKLTPAAMETLAIVAYRQPILRAELEAIRGVACGEVLRGLMERRLVKIVGRAEELGRPMLYGTTGEFLKIFGLANLDDLPAVEGLERTAPRPPRSAKAATKEADLAEAGAEPIADAGTDANDGSDDEAPRDG